METDRNLLMGYIRLKQKLQDVEEQSIRKEEHDHIVRQLQERCQRYADMAQKVPMLRAQNKALQEKLAAARQDLTKAEEVEQELEDFLDNEVHPNYPYDLYLNLMDTVRSIVDWEHADKWKEGEDG